LKYPASNSGPVSEPIMRRRHAWVDPIHEMSEEDLVLRRFVS